MWCILGLCWSLVAVTGAVWAAAHAAAALAGGHVPAFSQQWVADLAAGRTARTWPGTPTWLVIAIAAAIAGRLTRAAAFAWWQITRHRRSGRGVAQEPGHRTPHHSPVRADGNPAAPVPGRGRPAPDHSRGHRPDPG